MTKSEMTARATEVAGLLKTLSHPARLRIACTLAEGERSVSELEADLDVHQPTLSQQLTVLREAGIVETRRDAKQIFYRLTDGRIARLVLSLYAIFCAEEE